MKRFLPGPLPDHARNLMRRLGYGEHRGYGEQISYARRVSGMAYPRYHAYVEDANGGMQLNLHVDQKEASYRGSHAHGGEYEGPLVEREMDRIVSSIAHLQRPTASAPVPSEPEEKKGFWSSLFGG